ncbi:early nodulin-55-2-like [Tripterygium wilfordii]|uniref:Early nodulin-55-2-like n=1 Tax=Tripterygium wilfordii TaxID=458696 RepID=A0A7J7CZ92_TRIWF|nr:blue copper protein-like [Tripterygium wilfordii]KAF5739431.1 early nodulin-55-2-like [Tripterygium wilfordii]
MGLGSNAMLVFVLLTVSLVASNGQGRTFIVGGSQGWRSGVNYTDWAIRNSPFYINDKLVFRYGPPSGRNPSHSVYSLPSLWNYGRCDFTGARLLANPRQGKGVGFTYVVDQWKVHYFASGEDNGRNCKDELMRFFVVPWPRPSE